jgi:predicted RNA-binding Zn-ribbon protein involved in translation (DUF1610 family)
VEAGEGGAMDGSELEARWAPTMAQASASMAEWRREHPQATLTEIEDALDARLEAMRAEMLVDAVQASRATRFAGNAKGNRPLCPSCGVALVSRGTAERTLGTKGGKELRVRRAYGVCSMCGLELFPPR